MQKYKVSASKSQKKYNIIVSAFSKSEAKDKLHKDGYSVLNISTITQWDIQGKKFLFQVEKSGEVKSWAILWDDIFKIYVKLRDDLGYNVLSLHPEWDQAQEDAQKRQAIIKKLEIGYKLQKTKKEKTQKTPENTEQSFYMQKKLNSISSLIEKVISKIEVLLSNNTTLSEQKRDKLEKIYEKLVHIKWSTNIIKLQEIGELALVKIGEIELEILERDKNTTSLEVLNETNILLKQFWSSKHFVESSKDYKKIIRNFFFEIQKNISFEEIKRNWKKKYKKTKIDTRSYSYLKTLLLLNTYKKKFSQNSKEMYARPFFYFNPFIQTEAKEKFFIKRKVIQQNISLLSAKKAGRISSYTTARKGISKMKESFYNTSLYISWNICVALVIFTIFFLLSVVWIYNNIYILHIPSKTIIYILPFIIFCSFFFHIQKKFLSLLHILLLCTLIIFLQVNF